MKYVCKACKELIIEQDAVTDYVSTPYGQYQLCYYHESCWTAKKKNELETLEKLKLIIDARPKKKWWLTTNIGKLLAARDKEK